MLRASGARRRAPGDAPGPRSPTLQPAAVPPTLIQESVAGDGRTVRLLRLLLTSHCIHDCAYCPLRRSADPERARLSARDVVRVVMDHHRRGLIDGLFLSSAVDRDADHTMGELVAVARLLRREQHYLGYVHLKVVPEADPALIDEAARWADRVSVNVELPSQRRLDALAPGRRLATMTRAMDRLRDGITDAYDGWRWRQRTVGWPLRGSGGGRLPRYAPAGQVTQLVVGVDDTTDAELLRAASELYRRERLRRVYYGGFVPTVGQPDGLPDVASPHLREVRLYQADWLIRNYGFGVDELTPPTRPTSRPTWTRSSPGPCAIPSASPSTCSTRRARRCCACRLRAAHGGPAARRARLAPPAHRGPRAAARAGAARAALHRHRRPPAGGARPAPARRAAARWRQLELFADAA
jgi:hypothetical protein